MSGAFFQGYGKQPQKKILPKQKMATIHVALHANINPVKKPLHSTRPNKQEIGKVTALNSIIFIWAQHDLITLL